ncbi:MAG: hypothetical protein AAFX56_14650 [Pseudomonadota bacterium]
MWISKPLYESLPYFYLAAGVISLAAATYVNHGYWPTICLGMGVLCIAGGLLVLYKRREARKGKRGRRGN